MHARDAGMGDQEERSHGRLVGSVGVRWHTITNAMPVAGFSCFTMVCRGWRPPADIPMQTIPMQTTGTGITLIKAR